MNKLSMLMMLCYFCFAVSCDHQHDHEGEHEAHAEEAHDHGHEHNGDHNHDEPEVHPDHVATVKAHFDAVLSGDLDAVMKDYTEESTIMTPDVTITGLENIRAFFEEIAPLFPKEGTTVSVDKIEQAHEVVYVKWHGETPTLDIPLATDSFVFIDATGKIDIQTFAAYMVPKPLPE